MIALILALIISNCASANVLFLDLNNSTKEIEEARKAAKKSKRQLIEYPQVPIKERDEITKFDLKINQLIKTRDKKCPKIDSEFCKKTVEEIGIQLKAREEKAKKWKFSREGFLAFLDEQKKNGTQFNSLVVSGHDGTGSFSGHLGRVGDEELAKLLEEAEIQNDIRAIHLWGCYTTSPGSLMLNWKKHFPNISLFTGYDGRAPLNDKPAGWQYLKGVIEKEPALLEVENAKKLQAILRKIPGANQVTAAIYSCEDYATLTDYYNFKDMGPKCDKFREQLLAQSPTYECFLRAKTEECENPPATTGSGPVREFYELMQKAVACKDFSEDPIFRNLSRDQAIRLIFFKEVIENFSHNYRNEMQESDQFLKDLGAPDDLRFQNLNQLSRKEILEKMERLLEFLQLQYMDVAKSENPIEITEREAKLHVLRNLQSSLTGTLGNLSSSCVPFNWTEPHKDDPSPCLNPINLGNSAVVDYLARKDANKAFFYEQVRKDLNKKLIEKANFANSSNKEKAEHYYHEALLKRLSTLQYRAMNQDQDSDLQLTLANTRVEWAEKAIELEKSGDPSPFENADLKAIGFKFNALDSQRKKNRLEGWIKNRVETFEKFPEKSKDPALLLALNELKRDLALEAISIEGLEKIRSQAGFLTDSTEAKDIFEKIGKILNERQIQVLERKLEYTVNDIREFESEGQKDRAKIEKLLKSREDLSLKIVELKRNSSQQWITSGEKYLLTPRFLEE
jgi:hypothetical protein